jgi:hypothetical protein
MIILYIYSTCWRMKSMFYEGQQPLAKKGAGAVQIGRVIKKDSKINEDKASGRSERSRMELLIQNHPLLFLFWTSYLWLLYVLYW